jgi:hypothetical protein
MVLVDFEQVFVDLAIGLGRVGDMKSKRLSEQEKSRYHHGNSISYDVQTF